MKYFDFAFENFCTILHNNFPLCTHSDIFALHTTHYVQLLVIVKQTVCSAFEN